MKTASKKCLPAYWFAFALVVTGTLLMLLAWSPLPSQAGDELPPRATPTPISRASAARSDDEKDDKPIGAYLGLQMQGAPDGVWTVVQWQDSAGGWHDVEGWRGTLDGGQKIWWVAQRDFDKGPFRWVIYEGQGGRQLATSESFYLPDSAEQWFWIEALSLAP
jgi:hypothetical protein